MSETAILNASPLWDKDLDDTIAPDFGFETLRPSQLAMLKPSFGRTWQRTVGNGGHSLQLSWVGRSRACVERLKQFAEQYEDGFFTVIDHDKGRHYVGNFVGDMPTVQAGHDRCNVQGWTFVEIPGCPMLQYPSEWERWAVIQRPFDDYGDQKTATFSAIANAWGQAGAVLGDDGVAVQPKQLLINAVTAGDWATHEYRGYGFRLWAGMGPAYGKVSLSVDGGDAVPIDLYSGDAASPQVVYENAQMPLDIHRVKITLLNTKNDASSNFGMLLDKFEVMR